MPVSPSSTTLQIPSKVNPGLNSLGPPLSKIATFEHPTILRSHFTPSKMIPLVLQLI